MITIHVTIPGVSLVAFAAALFACAPCVLAIVLACGTYSSIHHLQIPVAMLGGLEGLNALFFLVPICITTTWLSWVPVSMFTVASGGLGLWWLGERLQTVSLDLYRPLETALLVIWLLSLGTSLAVCVYALDRVALVSYDLPTSPNPSTNSWPETLVTEKPFETNSMHAPYMARNITPESHVAPLPEVLETHRVHQHRQSHTHTPEMTQSPVKRSPGKTNVPLHTKGSQVSLGSVFSFKRSPSKLVKPIHEPPMPSLAGLDALPEGFHPQDPPQLGPFAVSAAAAASVDDPHWDESLHVQDRMKWIMMNSSDNQSRSVSGSTNLSGSLFGAAEYNRQINDAGFVKDEPSPFPRRPRA